MHFTSPGRRCGAPALRALAACLLAATLQACDSPKPAEVPLKPAVVAPPPVPIAKPPAAEAPRKPPAANTADAELAARVRSALAATPGLQSFTMDVTASDGVVSLFGTAPDRATRDKAAATAAKVEGVKSVKNNLAIVAGS